MANKSRNGLPAFCSLVIDRHKKKRIRFRAKGVDTYLPYPPTGEQFTKAYAMALAGVEDWKANIGESRTKPGSINALVVSFYRSPKFTGCRPSTQQTYRRIIERFRAKFGDALVRDMNYGHVSKIIGAMADRRQAANRLLSLLKILMDHAIALRWISVNPTTGVEGFSKKTDGFHTWTEAEISAFEARHPIGSKARLALSLLLYTAQRRSDVVRMGWQHIAGDYISVRQMKTGTPLDLYILPELIEAIRDLPRDKPTFLLTHFDKPFTHAGFGNWFRDRCNEAGLSHCTAHGLRKAAARRMAEAGMSADIIKAVTGHTDLKQVSIYTRAANQASLAKAGLKAIAGDKKQTDHVQPSKKVGQNEGETDEKTTPYEK